MAYNQQSTDSSSILFATVPFTLANKRRRYVPALCELDMKKEGVRGGGGGKGKRKARRRQKERERKRNATVADNRGILTRTRPKLNAELLFILALQGTGANSILFSRWKLSDGNVCSIYNFERCYHFQAIHGHIFKFWCVKSQSLGGERT